MPSKNYLGRVLTHELLLDAVVYDPDTGKFDRKPAGVLHGKPFGRRSGPAYEIKHNAGYLQISLYKKAYLVHRLAWFYTHGVWPKQIDHVNGNRTDNRWCNLRESDHSKNGMNSKVRSHSKIGVKGVFQVSESKTFGARITVRGKIHQLGSFPTIEEASAAYQAAAARLHGDFAYHKSQENSHG